MKKSLVLYLTALLACTILFAFSSFPPIGDANDDLSQLKALNAKFIHNFVTNDEASHDKIIRPEFVCITSRGKMLGREEYLEGWKSGFDPKVYLYWDYRNEKITVVGNTALVRSVKQIHHSQFRKRNHRNDAVHRHLY